MLKITSRLLSACTASLWLAACSGQKDPAQKLIADIDTSVTAASTEAAKYVPDQLADVQGRLGGLKASYDKKDYAAVVTNGPLVLSAAQALATAAAAKKDDVLKALSDEWTSLSGTLPAGIAALQNRIETLGKGANKKSGKKTGTMAAGIDADAAQSALADDNALWSKAQAAFASGNLDEAVTTAKDLKGKLEALAGQVGAKLPAAGSSPAGSSPAEASTL